MICDEDPLRRRPRESTARRKRQERCVWMARKMTEWPSKRGPITKIMPSDGCIGDTVPLAVGKWYEFHEFGWYMGNVGSDIETDIAQMTSRFAEIIPPYHRRGNRIPFAAIRWPDFGDQPSVGSPFAQFFRHSDTLLLSFSPRRRCPRPTPERVLVADHRSGSGFSGTVPSAPPPRPIGT